MQIGAEMSAYIEFVVQVCWSDDGERFAGLGDGGVVATWRLDAPRMAASDTAYLGRSDWCHQVLLLSLQHIFQAVLPMHSLVHDSMINCDAPGCAGGMRHAFHSL